jgi:hypothetical protein
MIPSQTSDVVVLLNRVLSRIDRPVRNCTHGDVLVLETDRRRDGGATLESGVRGTVYRFFQVTVRVERHFLTIAFQRVITCWGLRLAGTGEECAQPQRFDLRGRGAVARAAQALAHVVEDPDHFLPTPGHRFPETGRPAWLDDLSWGRTIGSSEPSNSRRVATRTPRE